MLAVAHPGKKFSCSLKNNIFFYPLGKYCFALYFYSRCVLCVFFCFRFQFHFCFRFHFRFCFTFSFRERRKIVYANWLEVFFCFPCCKEGVDPIVASSIFLAAGKKVLGDPAKGYGR